MEADLKHFRIAVGVLVAIKLTLLFVLVWNRRFVMDEFVQFGWAKYIPDQLGQVAIHHPKALGYALFFYPAHLIGWNARSMLLIGRMQTALLACGTLAVVHLVARSLGQSRLRAALILLVLLSFSNFMERIFETRAEPLAVFFAAAALLVAVRADGSARRIVAAGVLSGCAFLSTQKSIYFDVALGLGLAGDAVIARMYLAAIARGAWLVVGWLAPVVLYWFAFGGSHPLPIAENLFFGPLGVASAQTAAEYGGLREFVLQTLEQNVLLYLFCIVGMVLGLMQIGRLDPRNRLALIFSIVIAALVFAHNQPWPYVFVMALPFMALWALRPIDALSAHKRYGLAAQAVLEIGVAASFVRNIECLRIDNHKQLDLVARAESLVRPRDIYFDGIGILPNRAEPSTLWLDRHAVLQTLRAGKASEAYRIFATTPPKVILWSYRMAAIEPVIDPLIRNSYVQVAPNIRIAGVRLRRGEWTSFNVPIAGRYGLYDKGGAPINGALIVSGNAVQRVAALPRGQVSMMLRSGPAQALLVPEGFYRGRFKPGADDEALFAHVYD